MMKIDFSIEAKKYFGGSLDELIASEDKLLTCNDGQCDWGAPAGEILDSFINDEQVELIESNSKSDNEACDQAESYVEIQGTLTSMAGLEISAEHQTKSDIKTAMSDAKSPHT